jgi:phosphomannomutase/phosphoglucomutase
MLNRQIFRQYDIRGIVDQDLNVENLYLIGKGFGSYLRNLDKKTVVIGGDARLTTPSYKAAFIKGLVETGMEVTDIGFVATPILYFAIWYYKVDAGTMITASHNPSNYNGIKLNLGLASVYGEGIQDVYELIAKEQFVQGQGSIKEDREVVPAYHKYIVENIEMKRPLKVVVDGGNGAGGPFLPGILRDLGCDVTELYCEPDGTFPNHHPDPTVLKNNKDLIAKVKEVGADIGLGLDGDADRIGVIDEQGNMLYGDQILNVIARDFLANNPGESVLADVKCSKNLYDDIAKHGGQPIMYKTGHANIKNEMKRRGIKVGGEMSGHVFLGDRYLGFDDAIYVCARFAEIASKTDIPVSRFLEDQPKMYNTPEIHFQVPEEKKFAIVNEIRDAFKAEGYEAIDIDGVRVTFKDGWGLCRASNTTPVLVLRYEAETEERMNEIKALFEEKLETFAK